MSEQPQNDINTSEATQESEETAPAVDELSLLKERATLMGIRFSPNIGIDTLKARIEEKTNPPKSSESTILGQYAGEEYATIQDAENAAAGAKVEPMKAPTPLQQKMARRDKALKLVRIRVSSMNPLSSALKGELIFAGNSEIGMVKKFVPFNAEQGWHVPQIILDVLRNKKFMTHYEEKQGNKKIKRHRLVPEFSIEILPPLTPEELEALKQRQLMAEGGGR